MEYVYAAMLIHNAGGKVDEASIKKVLEAAGAKIDDTRIKALVTALEGVDIEEAIKKTTIAAPAAPTAPAEKAEKKEEKKDEAAEKKAEESAAAGLSALFG